MTPISFLSLSISFLSFLFPNPTLSVNITEALLPYSALSSFTRLLSATPIPGELSARSSLTVLAVPNQFLPPSSLSTSSGDISDILRYHILLEYLSAADLRHLPPAGKLITTLFQTTGRAPSNFGSLNLSLSASNSVIVRSPAPFSPSNASILSQVTTFPYNLSVLAVDSLLIPFGFDLSASETRPAPPAVNITRVLLDAKEFNVAASMLEASGVASEFEGYEHGVGITIFAPTDQAFASGEHNSVLRSLPAEQKSLVLRFHALHSYYPLGSLQSIVNPVQPTVATEDTKAGWYTLNITRVNGSVAIGTGLVQAAITRTVFDQNPVAVFAVSKVLLPREVFGHGGGGKVVRAAPPAVELAGISPEAASGPAMAPDSEGTGGEMISESSRRGVRVFCLVWCIGLVHVLVG